MTTAAMVMTILVISSFSSTPQKTITSSSEYLAVIYSICLGWRRSTSLMIQAMHFVVGEKSKWPKRFLSSAPVTWKFHPTPPPLPHPQDRIPNMMMLGLQILLPKVLMLALLLLMPLLLLKFLISLGK